MEFFKKYFKLDDARDLLGNGEYNVCCPFPHKDHVGNYYTEKNPSAHINPDQDVFHCKVCDLGLSEASFLARIEGISYKDALVTIKLMTNSEHTSWEVREENLMNSQKTMELVNSLGITADVRAQLRLGYNGAGIDFPVIVYDEILDVRNYKPDRNPKVLGKAGSKNLILPFDLWREDARPTVLVAGEKDMAIARVHGFNSITFTGGEGSFPKLFKHSFKGRHIYIVYDNDAAGRDGAGKAAHFIKEAGGTPYIVDGHYATCTEKGEDLWDFFMKYGKTARDLQAIFDETPAADGKLLEKVKENISPMIRVGQAAQGAYVNRRFVRSKVTILSIFEEMFNIPEYVVFEKTGYDEKSFLDKGETVEWVLDDDNIQDILYLMDGRVTKATQKTALMQAVGLGPKEAFIEMKVLSTVDVYKSVITDAIDTSSDATHQNELVLYSLKHRLDAGKQYVIQYKPTTHPTDGQHVVGILNNLEEASTSIENFKVTSRVKESLRVFQQGEQSVEDKMDELFERSKGFIGVEARKKVSWATDMFYHTPLDFKIGRRVERAYLDVMIVGDPRTMKSETAKRMREMYELGTVTSMKTASVAGLIGGSDKVAGGGFKTKVGLLPQSHKGAVIMEEFSGGGRSLISQLTEIRSSGRVRITRVNGITDVAARVRMLSISNPATKGGMSMSLAQYPSGVNVVLDLVGASEDIARYDFFVLVDEPKHYTSPLDMFDLEPYPKESYMNRIRWVWSRTAEQVDIQRDVAEYLMKVTGALNEDYDCNIKFFGAEAWKKLIRVAISVAGMLVSTDEKFERIIVTKEHIDFAAIFLKNLYDNPIFKLRGYVENQRAYNVCREVDIDALQKLYNNHAPTLRELELSVNVSQKQLQLVSGMGMSEFADLVSRLGASKFIQWQGEKIVPTGKFRQAMKQMQDNYLKAASERS